MGWRFRRSVKLLPGVRLNFSKSGISTTIGGRGARTTFGRGKVTHTFGIPGTGLSYTSTSRSPLRRAARQPVTAPSRTRLWPLLVFASLFTSMVCYLNGSVGSATLFLILAVLPVPPVRKGLTRALAALRGRHPSVGDGSVVDSGRTPPPGLVPSVADAQAVAALDALADKLRVLLFIARADGALRAKERDVIVAHLQTLEGASDLTDEWLKAIHAKMPRDTFETMTAAVVRLGRARQIDEAFIGASEALATLTKNVSVDQLKTLKAIRHERAERLDR